MSLLTKVGSFSAATTTGTHAVTGVGFQPKLLFLWGTGQTADGSNAYSTAGTPNTLQQYSFGICAVSGATSDQASVSSEEDFTAGGPLYSGDGYHLKSAGTTHGIRFDGTPGTGLSLDADGFTPNYLDALNASVINYMAIGGSEIQTVIVGAVNITGFSTGNHAFTGFGFKPDALILWGGTVNSAGIGFVSSLTDRFTMSNGFLTDTAEYFRSDKAFACYYQQTKDYEADIVSFDADGCTLNFSTINGAASGNTMNFVLLGLKGVKFKAGTFTEPGSTGNRAVTGMGFQPSAVLLNSLMYPASTSPQTHTAITGGGASWAVGGTDGTNRGAIAYRSWTDGCIYLKRTKVYGSLTDTGTVTAEADITSLDRDGFTLNWSSVSGNSSNIGYFGIGPIPGSTLASPELQIPNPFVGPQAMRYNMHGREIEYPQSAGSVAQTIQQALTATSTTTASIIKQVGKTLSATSATTASMVRQVGKILSATSSTTATIIKQVGKTLSATVTDTATLATIKAKGLTLSATVTTTASMVKQVGKILSATSSTTASIIKQVGKNLTANVTDTATLSTIKAKAANLTANVSTTASMVRQTAFHLTANVASLATLLRQIPLRLTANVSILATLDALLNGTVTFLTGAFDALTHRTSSTKPSDQEWTSNPSGNIDDDPKG